MQQKIYASLDSAVADIRDGARIMFGGFGGAGFPNNLILALAQKGTKDLTAVSNNCGTRDGELGLLFKNGQIRHVIASFPGPNSNYFQEQLAEEKVTLELVPQGILCERMRAAAACRPRGHPGVDSWRRGAGQIARGGGGDHDRRYRHVRLLR